MTSTYIMDLTEVAAYLKISPATVYRHVKTGEIPAFKVGRAWRFPRAQIDKWRLSQSIGK